MAEIFGTVYWITGLSGSGKTTIASRFYRYLMQKQSSVIFLDGDALRVALSLAPRYDRSSRLRYAMKYSGLCKMFSEQGHDVVCSTISMFHQCRDWNRSNIKNYKEIYIKTPMHILCSRDIKGVYKKNRINVVGKDLPIEEPKNPDLILINNGSLDSEALYRQLCENIYREEKKI